MRTRALLLSLSLCVPVSLGSCTHESPKDLQKDGIPDPMDLGMDRDMAPDLSPGPPQSLAICTQTSWCWENPSPQGAQIRALRALDSGVVYGVGDGGLILREEGAGFRSIRSPTKESLYGLFSQGNQAFAVGTGGTLLHLDERGEWHSLNDLSALHTGRLRSLWSNHLTGVDADLIAVGDAGTILHREGGAWRRMDSGTTEDLYAVWGRSQNEVYAVGRGTILRYDGQRWQALASPTKQALYGIFADKENVWLLGSVGTLLRLAEGAFIPVKIATKNNLVSAFRKDDGPLWIVGEGGALFEGTEAANGIVEFRSHAVEAGNNPPSQMLLWSIWGRKNSDLYAAGRGGSILHYNGVNWRQVSSGFYGDLLAVATSGDARKSLYAAGRSGVILHRGTAGWNQIYGERGANGETSDRDLVALSGSQGILYGLSAGGTLVRVTQNGSMENRVDVIRPGDGKKWYGLYAAAPSQVYLVGALGQILSYDGNTFHTIESGTTTDLLAVGGSPSEIYAVGLSGTTLSIRPSKPPQVTISRLPSTTSQRLQSIYAAPDGTVYLVGGSGTVLYKVKTQTNFVPFADLGQERLYTVFGDGNGGVVAAGERGNLFRLPKGQSTFVEVGAGLTTTFFGGTDGFVVGDYGAVLRANNP